MKFVILTILLLLAKFSFSTHILGSHISYKYISGTTIGVTVVVYQEANSTTPFDGTNTSTVPGLILGVFQGDSLLIDYTNIADPTITFISVPGWCNASNYPYIARGEYYTLLQLPDSTQSYTLSWQRCCLINNHTNVLNSGDQGLNTYITIPPIKQYNNNSIQFSDPDFFAKIGQPFLNDVSGVDIDSDSVSYEFVTPNVGGEQTNPAPSPPLGPPYTNLIWASGFDSLNLTGGNNILLNEFTGIISYSPNVQGIYLIPILASEYRNGMKITEQLRTFTIFTSNDCAFFNHIDDLQEHAFLNKLSQHEWEVGCSSTSTVRSWQLSVYDASGKVMMNKDFYQTSTRLNTIEWSNGIYFIEIKTATYSKTFKLYSQN